MKTQKVLNQDRLARLNSEIEDLKLQICSRKILLEMKEKECVFLSYGVTDGQEVNYRGQKAIVSGYDYTWLKVRLVTKSGSPSKNQTIVYDKSDITL